MSDPNQYADEGTIAHALAAICLAEGKPAAAYVGRVIRSEDYEHAMLSPSTAPRWMVCAGSHALEARAKFKPRTFSQQVTQDMADGVQIYLDNLLKRYVKPRDAELMIEQKLPVDHLTGEEGATGAGDAVVLDMAAFEIQVHDLKFGRGVEVMADDNEQLLMYLSGALRSFGEFAPEGGWTRFRGVIHQPRIKSEPDECVWTIEELRAFEKRCKDAAGLAIALKAQAMAEEEMETYLTPGDKQCKFCDAKPDCKAFNRMVTTTVAMKFDNLDALPEKPTSDVLTPIPSDNERLAKMKAWTPLIRAWCDAVDARAEAEILAGRPVPGFKAVQGKKGNRAWEDEKTVEEAMKKMRIKHDEMYDYSVISPTTAEKRLAKQHPKLWAKLQAFITQAPGKPTVVPLTDKRPALELKPVEEKFEALGADLAPEDLV